MDKIALELKAILGEMVLRHARRRS